MLRKAYGLQRLDVSIVLGHSSFTQIEVPYCTLQALLLTAHSMAWGAKGGRGVDDLVDRLTRNDPSLASLHIFSSRRFGPEVHAPLTLRMPRLQLPASYDQ